MEGEVGAQIAPTFCPHQPLPGRFHGVPMARKRDLPWQNPSFPYNQHFEQSQQLPAGSGFQGPSPGGNWDAKMWGWDSVRFSAKPSDALSLGTQVTSGIAAEVEQRQAGEVSRGLVSSKGFEEDGENLALKLGGGSYTAEAPVVRPNKRVRSGSPGSGSGNYPMCQVDDCKADLSNAKDYHRRHKVCEVHSKTTKALVGKQMQRFCQQCSRFHPLSEFDEGKRSCRRRLAGHNRRRRKTQPEDASSQLLSPGNQENNPKGNMDLVSLLAILAGLQGNSADKVANPPPLPDKDGLVQILSKINSLPTVNSTARPPASGGFDLNVSQASQQGSLERQLKTKGNLSAPSTMDLLAVLSSALVTSSSDAVASQSQGSSEMSGEDKAKTQCAEPAADVNSQTKSSQIFPAMRAGRSSFPLPPSYELPELVVQEARPSIPLQLFSMVEEGSPQKLDCSRKYLSSESSNPMDERSPSSSPPVAQKLFPLRSASERLKHERMLTSREDNVTIEASTSHGWNRSLDLFNESERRPENGTVQVMPYQGGYTSSSGSDHSPSSSNSDSQDRTGRIIFKLFDKDPSSFPAALRTQILNWLSHSPSEMESYIRPGCVVLSIYILMPSIAWEELEEDLLRRVNTLIQYPDSEFWRNGRFLVRTNRQLVSHKDGKIRLCKSWTTWSAPELTSVSPVAVVGGQETCLVLKGRNLTVPGTKIHCAYKGGYSSKEVLGSAYLGTIYDDSSMESFNFPGGSPNVFGRCFIEVENGFKGNSFPIIIANADICQELRVLETELKEDVGAAETVHDEQALDYRQPRSRDDVLQFLNELGWLFQKETPCLDFSILRFKFLFAFSVERDWSALIKMLLDILAERSLKGDGLWQESLDMLLEVQLLSRAVMRKCRKMVTMLLHCSVTVGINASKVYPFPPNMAGPGGVTPLHLAASIQDSDDMVDVLTDDPQEIGLSSWNSIRDDNGQSPYAYASLRNNHSYNRLVARKLADRRNGQVSVNVRDENPYIGMSQTTGGVNSSVARRFYARSCADCAMKDIRDVRSHPRMRVPLYRPYVHSMLAIAAVCVCVCLFFRGALRLGCRAEHFKWENLNFGPR